MLRSFAVATISLAAVTCDAHTHSTSSAFSLPPAVRGWAYAAGSVEGRPRRCRLGNSMQIGTLDATEGSGRTPGGGLGLLEEKLEYEFDSAGRSRLK